MKNRLELNLDGSAFNIRFQNPATQRPLRPLRFLKWTFTVPIIIQLDSFNRTKFVTTYWNLKAVNFGRHHLLPASVGKNAARNRAAKSDKKRQRICRNLSLQLVTFCRLLSLGAQLVFNAKFAILDRARATPYFKGNFAARQFLADGRAESRKMERATAGKTSCKMLRWC
jgi:hypothetical protein